MAESKSDYFSFKISVHSEKIAKLDLLPANRLAASSEFDPLTSVRSGHRADSLPCPLIAAPIGNGRSS
jgi:hypothetical protein